TVRHMNRPHRLRRSHRCLTCSLLQPPTVQSADKWRLFEVIFWRRRRYCPLKRTAIFPHIIWCILRLAYGDDHVNQQDDRRYTHRDRTDCTNIVHLVPACLSIQIRVDTTRHTDQSEPVLYEERQVEADEE